MGNELLALALAGCALGWILVFFGRWERRELFAQVKHLRSEDSVCRGDLLAARDRANVAEERVAELEESGAALAADVERFRCSWLAEQKRADDWNALHGTERKLKEECELRLQALSEEAERMRADVADRNEWRQRALAAEVKLTEFHKSIAAARARKAKFVEEFRDSMFVEEFRYSIECVIDYITQYEGEE